MVGTNTGFSLRRYPSIKELAKIDKVGRYSAGPNLLLQVSAWHTRSWIFRYARDGKTHHMGLGSCDLLTLAEARDRAHALRRQLKIDGVDPLEARRAKKRERQLASTRTKTFRQVALEYIVQHEHTWRGDGSRRQWLQSMERHVFPKIGALSVADIGVPEVLLVLDPIWRKIPETAARVRHRLTLILDWAAARELRGHDNPAKRPKLLPARKKRVEHLAAMPYQALPGFVAELRGRPELSARMLELLILTVSRPGEITGMRWSEVDAATWTVPGERMKSGRAHRVPLSGQAVGLLARLPREGELVFPGRFSGTRSHTSIMMTLLRRMGHAVTTHGFRASFKTWASERTNYPRELIEAALAHVIGDAAEQAYSRGDMLARRRQLMEAWANYFERPNLEGDVVPMRG